MPPSTPHVGTLGEKPLHAALKRSYARPGDRVEHPVDGFVIDLVRGDTLIEIQTRGFSAMKRKLGVLVDHHDVRVVHPIPLRKWIVRLDAAGAVVSRRASPVRGSVLDVFAELVSFPHLVAHPRFTLEVALIHEDEVRRHESGRAWRRKGWVVQERRLVEVVDRVVIAGPDDLAGLLPGGLAPEFTTADLAAGLDRPRHLAQQMAYCLRGAGAIEVVGKQGNALVYRRGRPCSPPALGPTTPR